MSKVVYELMDGNVIATVYSGDAMPSTKNVLSESSKEVQEYLANQRALAAAPPKTVTMRQAKLALLQAGLLDDVDAAIAAESTPKSIKIEWEYASEVQRDWVNTLGLAATLGLTDEQLDDLFVLAASL